MQYTGLLRLTTGEPSRDPAHPDYVPSVLLYGSECSSQQVNLSVGKVQRYTRAKRRSEIRFLTDELGDNDQSKENQIPAEEQSVEDTCTVKVESLQMELAAMKEELSEVKEELAVTK